MPGPEVLGPHSRTHFADLSLAGPRRLYAWVCNLRPRMVGGPPPYVIRVLGGGAAHAIRPRYQYMNKWTKIGIGIGGAEVMTGAVWFTIRWINKDVVTVQTAAITRQDLTSVVTASGEIKPLTYTNVLGEGIGKITEIVVKEGDHVKKGDVLLRLESVQPSADVDAQRAGIEAADAGVSRPKQTESRRRLTSSRAPRIWNTPSWNGTAARNFSKRA